MREAAAWAPAAKKMYGAGNAISTKVPAGSIIRFAGVSWNADAAPSSFTRG